MNPTYVTTTIPYVNARPHVGFALELAQADALARYRRLRGSQVRLQTGTDENAFKNAVAARQLGLSVQEHVDNNAQGFRCLAAALDLLPHHFVRTTSPAHRRAVHAFWRQLRPEDVYRKSYQGLYCVGCEDFYLERDLVEGRCPDHGTEPEVVEEENWFFRLSAYQDTIKTLIEKGQLEILPAKCRREVLAFIERGLEDISISRCAQRQENWGIEVPGDPSQVVYVWIDALFNYLSGTGFGAGQDWRRLWNGQVDKVHFLGKNVWKFHGVYWPALLLSAGLPLPQRLVVHGFLTEGGRKISKSTGGSVDPLGLIKQYGADALRFFLLAGISPFEDGDFSTERLRQVYNSHLANGLGNLCSRLQALAGRCGLSLQQERLQPPPPAGYGQFFEQGQFGRAAETVWSQIGAVNRQIDQVKPWVLLRQDKALVRPPFGPVVGAVMGDRLLGGTVHSPRGKPDQAGAVSGAGRGS